MKRISILNIAFDAVKGNEAVSQILTACRSKQASPLAVVTPNPIMVMNAQKDKDLFSAITNADLSLADGVGIISAAKRMGTPLPERVTGIDTGYAVLKKLAGIGGSVYLLGAKPGVAELAADRLIKELPGLRVVGAHDGYFENNEEIISEINERSPDLLLVCLGSPKQEIWVDTNREKICGVGAIICLGGALDVWSGNTKRAPSLFIRLHLEWLWRMLCEPKRIRELPKMIKFRSLTRKTRQKDPDIK